MDTYFVIQNWTWIRRPTVKLESAPWGKPQTRTDTRDAMLIALLTRIITWEIEERGGGGGGGNNTEWVPNMSCNIIFGETTFPILCACVIDYMKTPPYQFQPIDLCICQLTQHILGPGNITSVFRVSWQRTWRVRLLQWKPSIDEARID